MNYFPLYTTNNILYPFEAPSERMEFHPMDTDYSYDSFVLYPVSGWTEPNLVEASPNGHSPLSSRSRPPRSHSRPRSRRSRPYSYTIRVKTCLKEYTDEKVNFFKVSDDDDSDDSDDTLEAYFVDFWNMCLEKNKRNCDSCLQPYYNKKEVERAEFELTCVICMVNKKSTVFIDCGHFAVCFECSKKCMKCPICSKVSKNILKVYLS
jgi:hypothetical protein